MGQHRHTSINRFAQAILLLAVMLASQVARAELLIRITEGADSAIPVAVVPFANSGNMPTGNNISRIVRDDLNMSGEFRTLESGKMVCIY